VRDLVVFTLITLGFYLVLYLLGSRAEGWYVAPLAIMVGGALRTGVREYRYWKTQRSATSN
jgi:hypothetical protein